MIDREKIMVMVCFRKIVSDIDNNTLQRVKKRIYNRF